MAPKSDRVLTPYFRAENKSGQHLRLLGLQGAKDLELRAFDLKVCICHTGAAQLTKPMANFNICNLSFAISAAHKSA